ncbi:hypothetical protein RhiirA1_475835 [Rhizophagus irregularis]|uniref:Uncharacterized protein n=1 Tax=Rhizophagus irregularis TaxID=588596 RepID=A0A2N0QW81_9GLOM|nr:hypothetical protein RhiirA1_475835 [Rhizophagus irregularis]
MRKIKKKKFILCRYGTLYIKAPGKTNNSEYSNLKRDQLVVATSKSVEARREDTIEEYPP